MKKTWLYPPMIKVSKFNFKGNSRHIQNRETKTTRAKIKRKNRRK